ncbi:isoleucine--tRNA ligase [Candidatus Woesearchaeota archaeon]|nr:isoleucine--tRNA ligase [Candidatus Woesearchaeota archaeon]
MAAKYDFKEIEPKIMKFWLDNSIYRKAKEKNKGKEKYYFLDGPPYTSGKVHIGTAWNKSLKDCFIRYKRMKGLDVWDRAGYDMHGLPTENATQKKLGLKTKEDISKFGISKFIEECKKLCIENMEMMNKDFEKLGCWMDFENAYQSIKKDFMQGEWWLIKKAHEKKRLYEGLRTMTWCPITESALAKHELEYKTVKDNSIFVKFKIKDKANEFLIIWTTTPWTIPFNLAIMVNPEVDYVRVRVEDEVWIVASVLANVFISGVVDKKFEILETIKGDALEGTEYVHPFYEELKDIYDDIKSRSKKAHTVLLSTEYVDTSGGSGLVHCAPGCGPEDYEIGHRNGIPPFNNISPKGVFPIEMKKFAGLTAKKDDDKFIKALEDAGSLIASTEVEHEYPHDWRYHEPVIFRTTKQWFFKVEDLKEKMVKANESIKWVPDAAFNAFDSWLKNLRDNSISKQRYWGTPLPVWRNVDDSDDYMVIGSAKELEELSGKKVEDLHISTVDAIEIKKDGKTYKRVEDILDVWVDAGTVSWNCLDYPLQEENFHELFPADFILEGKDQIRGWFNLLMVASMIALDKPSFKNVYMHGFVQDAQGRKMSKSLGNYILPEEVISEYGADTLRNYCIGGANPGVDLNYNFEDMKTRYKNLTVLWNVHNYLLDLCSNYNINPKNLTKVKDFAREERYIFSKLNSMIKGVTDSFENYRLNEVPDKIEKLYLELSRTYIQQIRDKASVGSKEDKELVAFTIYRVLLETIKMLATITPFAAEKMYLNLKKAFDLEQTSIHLNEFPKVSESLIDPDLEEEMDTAQNIIQSILAGREKIQRGVRWPVKEAIVVTKDAKTKQNILKADEVIKSQTNVKNITIVSDLETIKKVVKSDFKTLGPDFGEISAKIIAKLTMESPDTVINHMDKDGIHKMNIDGKTIELQKHHIIIQRISPENLQESSFRQGFIYLNKEMDENLEAEGFSRELMRRVQALRKKSGFEKKDSINLVVKSDEELAEYFKSWETQIKDKCGAEKVKISEDNPARKLEFSSAEKVKGKSFEIFMEKRGKE